MPLAIIAGGVSGAMPLIVKAASKRVAQANDNAFKLAMAENQAEKDKYMAKLEKDLEGLALVSAEETKRFIKHLETELGLHLSTLTEKIFDGRDNFVEHFTPLMASAMEQDNPEVRAMVRDYINNQTAKRDAFATKVLETLKTFR